MTSHGISARRYSWARAVRIGHITSFTPSPSMTRTRTKKQQALRANKHRHAQRESAAAAVIFGTAAVLMKLAPHYIKTPMHTSTFSGLEWMEDLLAGHDSRFYNQFGMDKFVFKHLLKALNKHSGFNDSKYVTTEEKLGIYLYACRTGLTNRKLQERFQRSGDTISRCVINFV